MTSERPLPTVIGPTENALRALLTKTLATTTIETYPAWVTLNAAARADESGLRDRWRVAVSDALKVSPEVVDEVIAALAAEGLIDLDDTLTPRGRAELAAARSAVAETTARLVEGVKAEEQDVTRRVLDLVRGRAEELLSA
ncbi:hypothetical protein [Homoserinibacter sp. GY 40078]|uniref:hypothetical protein n=1 Tax=Homoserinibacter sp. GY 40078 TaxID=2603275 RepID=UPI0011CC1E63|nr:hypothetical protein [Homoserinibacter sp. GY 40078]TXK19638.1 hypothetical protein FVQ89_07155 [Homoserinibacter sp. GY 40078]